MEDMKELTAEEQADILRHELEAVYGSSSYRIGRAVTGCPACKARPEISFAQRPDYQRKIYLYLCKVS